MNTPLPILSAHVLDAPPIDPVELGLARLAGLLESESESLLRLAGLLGLPAIPHILGALEELRPTGSGDDRRDLHEACALLARLLAILRSIPSDPPLRCSSMPGDEVLARDLDAAVRWCGARVEEQLAVLSLMTDALEAEADIEAAAPVPARR